MANPFVHLELNTPSLEDGKKFYADLFGWSFTDFPMGPGMTYSTFKPDTGPGGGLMSIPDAPNAWLAYIGVDDLEAYAAKATTLGAQIIVPPQEVPEMGRFVVLKDPGGASIALWEPKTP
ncbi:VOC family protein [Granulicella arctica]|uniref:VOC domain-containing protein n=1 Tax=Granulicella arctica TaxID=940613 RepID=A0A7Y9PEW3_9BACT|nr:VOC family protein [Granulicella arctica]NYF78635.1 hypothetical protein [Granulicella arctica]